jgi:hypothetical protein
MDVQLQMMEKIVLAKMHRLLPQNISELEFSYCPTTGQASTLEYWPNSNRLVHERVEVTIPDALLYKFVFTTLANRYQNPQC